MEQRLMLERELFNSPLDAMDSNVPGPAIGPFAPKLKKKPPTRQQAVKVISSSLQGKSSQTEDLIHALLGDTAAHPTAPAINYPSEMATSKSLADMQRKRAADLYGQFEDLSKTAEPAAPTYAAPQQQKPENPAQAIIESLGALLMPSAAGGIAQGQEIRKKDSLDAYNRSVGEAKDVYSTQNDAFKENQLGRDRQEQRLLSAAGAANRSAEATDKVTEHYAVEARKAEADKSIDRMRQQRGRIQALNVDLNTKKFGETVKNDAGKLKLGSDRIAEQEAVAAAHNVNMLAVANVRSATAYKVAGLNAASRLAVRRLGDIDAMLRANAVIKGAGERNKATIASANARNAVTVAGAKDRTVLSIAGRKDLVDEKERLTLLVNSAKPFQAMFHALADKNTDPTQRARIGAVLNAMAGDENSALGRWETAARNSGLPGATELADSVTAELEAVVPNAAIDPATGQPSGGNTTINYIGRQDLGGQGATPGAAPSGAPAPAAAQPHALPHGAIKGTAHTAHGPVPGYQLDGHIYTMDGVLVP